MNVADVLKQGRSGVFRSVVHYHRLGDFVTYYSVNEACYGERVDCFLTVYRSWQTGELVGCKVKEVVRLLRELGASDLVNDANATITLGMILTSAQVLPSDGREVYQDLKSRIAPVRLSVKELKAVG